MKAISEFDSLTTCSKRVAADLVESRSEKFQENEKKWTWYGKFSKGKGTFIFLQFLSTSLVLDIYQ